VNYGEWIEKVPQSIKSDPLWEIEVYRKALFLSDLAWRDCEGMLKHDGSFGIQGVDIFCRGAARCAPTKYAIYPPRSQRTNMI
jgi:hypothetical protein